MPLLLRHLALIAGLTCFLFTPPAWSQQLRIDSLMAVWRDARQQDTVRGQALDLAIQYGYLFTQPDSADYYAQELYALAQRRDHFNLMYSALSLQGIVRYLKGDYLGAAEKHEAAYALAEAKGDESAMTKAMINTALALEGRGDYPMAIENYLGALQLAEARQDSVVMAGALANLGNLFLSQEEYDKSINYSRQALSISEAIRANDRSLSPIYGNLAQGYLQLRQYDEAERYARLAIGAYDRLGNLFGKALSTADLGHIALGRQDIAMARRYFTESLSLARQGGMPEGISTSLTQLGEIDAEAGDYREARAKGEEALAVARSLGSPEQISPAADLLHRVYKAIRKPDQALAMYELHVTMEDSIRVRTNQKELLRKQFQYDYDKKTALAAAEQEKKDAIARKELQRQKEMRNAFMGGFAVVLLFAGVFLAQRNKIRKGKALSDSLLLNILPEEVAEELKVNGKAEARHFDQVTVLFTDFKGFTRIAEHMSPGDLVEEIHACFKAFDEIIGRHNIEKIKTIGDSYMCAGGLPSANRTNAVDIVRAALDMRAFMQIHQAERQRSGKAVFEMRIGIHTGPVVAGIVGVKKFAYDIWGNTVNLASRMESSGEPGRINISGQTHALVKDHFTCTYRGKIEARNIGEVEMYFVEEALGA